MKRSDQADGSAVIAEHNVQALAQKVTQEMLMTVCHEYKGGSLKPT